MRVVPEKQLPDGPGDWDMFRRYVLVFALGFTTCALIHVLVY